MRWTLLEITALKTALAAAPAASIRGLAEYLYDASRVTAGPYRVLLHRTPQAIYGQLRRIVKTLVAA